MRLRSRFPLVLSLALVAATALGQEVDRSFVKERLPKDRLTTGPLSPLVKVEVEHAQRPGERVTPRSALLDAGLGFVVRPDGLIAAPSDLVTSADKIMIAFSDGRKLSAGVVAIHSGAQVALVQVLAFGLPTYPLERSSTLKAGAQVTLQMADVARAGALCGRGAIDAREGVLFACFRTPLKGPSGAPLLSAEGKVIGLTTRFLRAPLPILGTLHLAEAAPAERIRELARTVPIQETPWQRTTPWGNGDRDLFWLFPSPWRDGSPVPFWVPLWAEPSPLEPSPEGRVPTRCGPSAGP